MFTDLHALLVVASLFNASVLGAPIVRWVSNPVSGNDTVLMDGEGLASISNSIFVCPPGSSRGCFEQAVIAKNDSTAAFVLPPGIASSSVFEVRTEASGGSVLATVNAPDVYWLTGGANGHSNLAGYRGSESLLVTQLSLAEGVQFRAFGRGLGYDQTGCLHATSPSTESGTTLVLTETGTAARNTSSVNATLHATSATCYDATFEPVDSQTASLWRQGTLLKAFLCNGLPSGAGAKSGRGSEHMTGLESGSGAYTHTDVNADILRRSGAASTALGADCVQLRYDFVVVAERPTPWPPVVLDVDANYGGNISSALEAARSYGGGTVRLGGHRYDVSAGVTFTLPSSTILEGAGMNKTVLSFSKNTEAPAGALLQSPSEGGFVLRDFGIEVTSMAGPAVHARPGSFNGTIQRVAVRLLQPRGMQNAMIIEGSHTSVEDCFVEQAGVADPAGSFQQVTTIYVHRAQDAILRNNYILWNVSIFDIDVSQRTVYEGNTAVCTVEMPPHGNSISTYDHAEGPWNEFVFFARNTAYRPQNNNNPHPTESLTTDGGYGSYFGKVLAVPSKGARAYGTGEGGSTLLIAQSDVITWSINMTRSGLFVMSGPGAGQWRRIVSARNTTALGSVPAVLLAVDEPFDVSPVAGVSVVGVSPLRAHQLIVGNRWVWGTEVQTYGTAIGVVMADNTLEHMRWGLKIYGGDYQGGAQPNWHVEVTKNTHINSRGFAMYPSKVGGSLQCDECGGVHFGPGAGNLYYVDYYRGIYLRDNDFFGVFDDHPTFGYGNPCAGANVTGVGAGVVLQGTRFTGCPEGNIPGGLQIDRTNLWNIVER